MTPEKARATYGDAFVESARATAARIDLSPEQVRRLRAIFATGRRRPSGESPSHTKKSGPDPSQPSARSSPPTQKGYPAHV